MNKVNTQAIHVYTTKDGEVKTYVNDVYYYNRGKKWEQIYDKNGMEIYNFYKKYGKHGAKSETMKKFDISYTILGKIINKAEGRGSTESISSSSESPKGSPGKTQ